MPSNDKSKLAEQLVDTISTRAGGRRSSTADEREGARNVNRRKHQRHFKPTLAIAFGHKAYPTRDWSLGGACVVGLPAELRVDSSHPVAVVIGQRQFPAMARIRRTESRQVGLQFTTLPAATQAVLTRLAR